VPATWSASRTRPLCAYPEVAIYKGHGDVEQAASWACRRPAHAGHDADHDD